MSFARMLSRFAPHPGTARQDFRLLVSNVAFGASPQNIAIPQSGVLNFSLMAGYVRFKASVAGSVSTITVTGTDGTNTELLVDTLANAVLSSNYALNMVFPFYSDLNVTSFNLQVTGSPGGFIDVEVAGTSGAF